MYTHNIRAPVASVFRAAFESLRAACSLPSGGFELSNPLRPGYLYP